MGVSSLAIASTPGVPPEPPEPPSIRPDMSGRMLGPYTKNLQILIDTHAEWASGCNGPLRVRRLQPCQRAGILAAGRHAA